MPHLVPRRHRAELRSSLWPVPTLFIAGAIVLALITLTVDHLFFRDVQLPVFLDPGGASDVRDLLAAIAAAAITVVALVASLTLVTLTVASTQFGPRLVRTFLATIAPKVTIGLFVGTFVYCLVVLLAVNDAGSVVFIPRISADVAVLLAIVDASALVWYLHATSVSIQPATVVNRIAAQLDEALDELAAMGELVDDTSTEELAAVLVRTDVDGEVETAIQSGYLKYVDHQRLVEAASSTEAVIRLTVRPGQFVLSGSPIALVVAGPDGRRPSRERINGGLDIGSQRTVEQDLRFAVDQLVEIAIRALSPAINDTFTALTCINWLAGALLRLSEDPLPQRSHRDTEGVIRVVDRHLSFADVTDSAFDKIRQAGHDNPAVLIRLLESVTLLGPQMANEEQRYALREQAQMVLEASERNVAIGGDRADVRRRYDEAVEALGQTSDGRRRLQHRRSATAPSPAAPT